MKKAFALLITLVMSISIISSTLSAQNNQYEYHFGNKTIIFNEQTAFSSKSRETIADKLMDGTISGKNVSGQKNILCIFGHKYIVDNVITITHCVSLSQPRCLKEIFEIGCCTRCDHTYADKIFETFITCCP